MSVYPLILRQLPKTSCQYYLASAHSSSQLFLRLQLACFHLNVREAKCRDMFC